MLNLSHASASVRSRSPEFVSVDLKDLHQLKSALESIQERVGPIRVLVNNAANDERHEMEDVTPEFWRDRLATNLDHYFFCIQGVAPRMGEAGGGSIINLSSCAWRQAAPGLPAYVTAKAAIEGLMRGLARSLGPKNIRINCVAPGFARTKRQVERWLTPELKRTILEGQCLKRFIEPEEVARIGCFPRFRGREILHQSNVYNRCGMGLREDAKGHGIREN